MKLLQGQKIIPGGITKQRLQKLKTDFFFSNSVYSEMM